MKDALFDEVEITNTPRSLISYGPFVLGLCAAARIMWQRFPSIYQQGTVWAEAGQLYFPQAQLESVGANLTGLDYGYVPLWCRLWALMVAWMGVHPAHAAHAYNAIALLVAAGCCAAFALPYFRKLMRSDLSRFLVCLGFAFAPDYGTKQFINASYYPAIVCCLILLMAVRAESTSYRKAILSGLGLGICMLSKPHYLAFAPFLLALLAAAAWRRSKPLAVLASLPLCAGAVQFAVLYANRATVARAPLALADFGALFGRWVISAMQHQLFGQAVMAASVYRLLAAAAVVFVAGRQVVVHRAGLQKLLWPVGLGLSLLFAGVTLGIVSFPDMYTNEDPRYLYGLLQIRHLFVPMVGCYLALALVLGQVRGRIAQPVVVALWLSVAWPFGFVAAPGEPTWPVVGFSAWSPLAHNIFDRGAPLPARGCIPINPYPRLMALDCQMLQEMAQVDDLLHRRASTLQHRYAAPKAAKHWLVDTIGMRVLNLDAGSQQLVAYDAAGMEMGRAQALVAPGAVLSFFNFVPPVAAPAAVALVDTAMQPSSLVMDAEDRLPMWVWLGRELGTVR